MSDAEIDALRREIRNLGAQQLRMDKDNRDEQRKDREAFERAMDQQRDQFQIAINRIIEDAVPVRKQGEQNGLMLQQIVGRPEDPEGGRLGKVETAMETMKQFRWQALTLGVIVMWILERVFKH